MTLIPIQDAPDPPVTPSIRAAGEQSIQLIDNEGRRWQGGTAIVMALEIIGWQPHLVTLLNHPPLRWGVEPGYRLVARIRHHL